MCPAAKRPHHARPQPHPHPHSRCHHGSLLTPTITTTPLPGMVMLENVTFIDQMNRWNYCGPANLAMALDLPGLAG